MKLNDNVIPVETRIEQWMGNDPQRIGFVLDLRRYLTKYQIWNVLVCFDSAFGE